MARLFQDAVLETLRHDYLEEINFGYRGSFAYRSGYQNVANLVARGHIRFEYVGSGDNAFAPATAPGSPHPWYVNRNLAMIDGNGHIRVRGVLGSGGRGTIVHEATHALQDFQRLNAPDRLGPSFTPENAEGAAHIAGWIARFKWGAPRPGPNDGTIGTIALARNIASQLMDGTIGPIVPHDLATRLDAYAANSIGTRSRYDFQGFF